MTNLCHILNRNSLGTQRKPSVSVSMLRSRCPCQTMVSVWAPLNCIVPWCLWPTGGFPGATDVPTAVLALWQHSLSVPGRGGGHRWSAVRVCYLADEVTCTKVIVYSGIWGKHTHQPRLSCSEVYTHTHTYTITSEKWSEKVFFLLFLLFHATKSHWEEKRMWDFLSPVQIDIMILCFYRTDPILEFPRPLMPNMVPVGGINCNVRNPLPEVRPMWFWFWLKTISVFYFLLLTLSHCFQVREINRTNQDQKQKWMPGPPRVCVCVCVCRTWRPGCQESMGS